MFENLKEGSGNYKNDKDDNNESQGVYQQTDFTVTFNVGFPIPSLFNPKESFIIFPTTVKIHLGTRELK
jgi:hypothetical protein